MALILSSPRRASSASTAYVITDLGVLNSNDQFSQGFGINNYGQVAGFSLNSQAVPHVFLWTPTTTHGVSGVLQDLGLCSSGIGGGFKLNSYGQLQFNRGVSTPSFGMQTHALLWTPATPNSTTGSTVDLLTLNGADGASSGFGINDNGVVVGSSYPGLCFIWTPASPHATTGTMTDLGNRSNGGAANAVNNSGRVAGSIEVTFFGYPTSHPGLSPYSTNDIIGLGPQSNQNDQTYSGTGYAINAAGHVTGTAVFPSPSSLRPFLSIGGTNLVELAPGGDAYGINNLDQVVGSANNNAILYANGTNYLLASLIDPAAGWPQLTSAQAINDSGQIVGTGAHNGMLHAYLLTPNELFLRITALSREGANLRVTWQTIGGTTNQVQAATGNFNFANLGSPFLVNGSGVTSTNYLDLGGATNGTRYYRIKMLR